MVKIAPETLRPSRVFSAKKPNAAALSKTAQIAHVWSGEISEVVNAGPLGDKWQSTDSSDYHTVNIRPTSFGLVMTRRGRVVSRDAQC